MSEIFLHKLPYLLFISLPFFAGILKLLYARRRNFYYSDHAVFTLYHYIFSFIILLLIFFSVYLQDVTGWRLNRAVAVLFIIWFLYLYAEMKNFYSQGWLKTLGKFLLLTFLASFIIVLLFFAFAAYSVAQI